MIKVGIRQKYAIDGGLTHPTAGGNLGGSVGIALTSTLLAQRSQFHQSRLVEHVSLYDPETQSTLHQLGAYFSGHGGDASQQALGMIYNLVVRQAGMLSYLDIFTLMGLGTLLVIPLAFLLPRSDLSKKGDAAASVH